MLSTFESYAAAMAPVHPGSLPSVQVADEQVIARTADNLRGKTIEVGGLIGPGQSSLTRLARRSVGFATRDPRDLNAGVKGLGIQQISKRAQ